MIVKVQRSIYPYDATVLVYNESGTVWYEEPMTGPIRTLLGNDPKRYFEAKLEGTKIHFGKRVKGVDW